MINPQIVYCGRNHSAKKENPSFLSTTCTLLLPSFSFNLKVLSAWKFGHGFFWENWIIHVATLCNNNVTLLMAETTFLIVKWPVYQTFNSAFTSQHVTLLWKFFFLLHYIYGRFFFISQHIWQTNTQTKCLISLLNTSKVHITFGTTSV